jgi:hypothetical protein
MTFTARDKPKSRQTEEPDGEELPSAASHCADRLDDDRAPAFINMHWCK